MSFRSVSKSVTLNDIERRNGRYFALFERFHVRCCRIKQLLGLPRFRDLLLKMTVLVPSADGLDGRVHFKDGEFSSGLTTRFDGRRCLALAYDA